MTYRANAARGASPIGLVVMLYEAAIDDMRQALVAMKGSNVEGRARACSHALLVLEQLQGTLDFKRGGAAAKHFEQFYNLVRGKLLEAQLRNSPELLGQQIQFMSEVRDCWIQADKQLGPTGDLMAAGTGARITEDGGATREWNA